MPRKIQRALALAALLHTGPASGVVVERQFLSMGTRATIVVEAADRATGLETANLAARALEAAERRLSTWGAESELLRLQRSLSPGPAAAREILDRELTAALRCAARTDGGFDPTVGALVAAWDLRGEGALPSPDRLAAALRSTGWAHLQRSAEGWISSTPDLRLDEGGFGKGAALDRALAATAGREGSILIDLGGQVALRGAPSMIDLADPDARDRVVGRLRLDGGSVATTGNSERGRIVDGLSVGHVLDPRTGRPAADFGSLTVVAATALDADCLSTGLYVLGPAAALERAESWPGVDVVVLRRTPGGPRLNWSSGLAGRVETLVDSSTSGPAAARSLAISHPPRSGARPALPPQSHSIVSDHSAGIGHRLDGAADPAFDGR